MSSTSVSENPSEVQPKTSKNNRLSRIALWKKLTLLAVLAGIIIFIAITLSNNAPLKTSNDFLNSIQSRNADAAYNLFNSESQKTITLADFKNYVNKVSQTINSQESIVSKEVKGEPGANATGKVVYEIKGTDDALYTFTVELVKENNQWRISNFDNTKK